MGALYTCDFCLKLFVEDELEMCCNCGEIFCIKCVPDKSKITLNGQQQVRFKMDKLHYCTEVCLMEDARKKWG